jgi:hypothetical protein
MATLGDEPHPASVALKAQAVAVIPGGQRAPFCRGLAELEASGHDSDVDTLRKESEF